MDPPVIDPLLSFHARYFSMSFKTQQLTYFKAIANMVKNKSVRPTVNEISCPSASTCWSQMGVTKAQRDESQVT